MTIVPSTRNNVFEPLDIEAMSKALEEVCKILNVANQAISERELLAASIVAFRHKGPRDAAFLRDCTLREITLGQGQWPAALARAAQYGAL